MSPGQNLLKCQVVETTRFVMNEKVPGVTSSRHKPHLYKPSSMNEIADACGPATEQHIVSMFG